MIPDKELGGIAELLYLSLLFQDTDGELSFLAIINAGLILYLLMFGMHPRESYSTHFVCVCLFGVC